LIPGGAEGLEEENEEEAAEDEDFGVKKRDINAAFALGFPLFLIFFFFRMEFQKSAKIENADSGSCWKLLELTSRSRDTTSVSMSDDVTSTGGGGGGGLLGGSGVGGAEEAADKSYSPQQNILAQADDIDISNVNSALLQNEWERINRL